MNKKRMHAIIGLFVVMILISGCQDNKEKEANEGKEIVTYGNSQWFLEEKSYEKDTIVSLINMYENLSLAQEFYYNIPAKCKLCQFVSVAPENRDNKLYMEEYYQVFEYIFQNRKLNEEYLFYLGNDSQVGNDGGLKLVRDHKEEILTNKNGPVVFIYDETWRGDADLESVHSALELGNPIGYGYAVINKGNAAAISMKQTGREKYYRLEAYDPEDHFSVVDYYSPMSEKSFRLADKEISIKEAVEYFEKYMSEFPFPKDGNMELKVAEVCVLEVEEGQYAYNFLTVGEYQGISFDQLRSGTACSDLGNYMFSGGTALMLESEDIDVIINFRKKINPIELKEMTEGISIEDAIHVLSSELTNHITFEVNRIELVYCQECIPDENGHLNLETYAMKISPWWKFTLYNVNDGLTYVFYIDAVSGEIRHFTTNRRLGLKQ